MNKQLISVALFALFIGVFAQHANAQASGTNPQLYMYRHNGSSGSSPMPAITGNTIGNLEWRALTAINSVKLGATIKSVATNVTPNFLTANMTFNTSGAVGLTERMIITETGLVGIGLHDPLFHLDVVGNTHTSGRFWGRIHFDNNPTDDAPNTYNDEAYFERKVRAQIGLAANPYTNGGILTLAPGGGSLDRQLFTGGDDGLWTRSQDLGAGNSWAAWEKLLTSGDIKGTPNRIARFLPPGPVSSKIGDSQLFDDGTDVGIGTATPDAAYLLTVGGDTRVNGNAYHDGKVGIGKAATGFDLDVAGESNFDGRVKVGAANFPTATSYELAVGGGIIAEEVLVQLQAWPDYVFQEGYALTPLSEVEHFIEKEKHLPGVISANDVTKEGLNLGEMQKVQMEKIEELYLHVIELNKQLQALKVENNTLKTKVEKMEQR